MSATTKQSQKTETTTWQQGFLKMMPMIEQQACVAFRHLGAEAQEDAVAEVVANAASAYERLFQRGELQRAFASALTRYAIAQFHDGRRVGTAECSSDIFSRRSKQSAGYKLLSLGAPGERAGEWLECLIDSRRTSIPEQVAFRLDFPRWLGSQKPRDKQLAERLAIGCSTSEVAHEFKISPARVSQLRRELADSWYAFIEAALELHSQDGE